jgi:hypothetical protein
MIFTEEPMANENDILDAIKRRNAPGTEVRLSRTIPGFLDGALVVADIMQDGKQIAENYYYDSRFFTQSRSFTSMDELVLWIGQQRPEVLSSPGGSFSWLSRFEVVSALIAMLITLTICTIVLLGFFRTGEVALRVPDILSNALTVILGFYFGSQVSRARQSATSESAAPGVPPQ